jgi:hypothetical protein
MKVGDLVRFKSNREDYKEFHGHVGLVVSVAALKAFAPGDITPVIRWLEPVIYCNKLSIISYFAANRYEVIS